MNRLWALLREISWTAVLSVASIVGLVVFTILGFPLEMVIALGSASIALAVLNLKA
jgi:hypothetical protein